MEEKKNKKSKHITLKIFILLSLLGIVFLAYKKITHKEIVDLKAIPAVNVTHIRKGSIEKDISLMGNILPNDTYYVVAKVGGDIKKINVQNGDFVKKGDVICEIDASKEIEAAFIQYDTAKKSYERMQKLYNAGDISLQNFESVKAQYEGLKLAYDTKVEYSTPVAVADGVIENTNMTINTSINQGTVICYITSKGAKEINFGVTERILDGIKLNSKVIIEKNGKKYDGYISNISNLINSSTGLFDIKAVITSENNFASGVMAKVTFPYLTKHNINMLPNEMIYYSASNPYVYIVNSNNVIERLDIEVGIENKDYTEVISDIDKSVKIVSTWNNDLAVGTVVNVVKDEEVIDEYSIEPSLSNNDVVTFETEEYEAINRDVNHSETEEYEAINSDVNHSETEEYEAINSDVKHFENEYHEATNSNANNIATNKSANNIATNKSASNYNKTNNIYENIDAFSQNYNNTFEKSLDPNKVKITEVK